MCPPDTVQKFCRCFTNQLNIPVFSSVDYLSRTAIFRAILHLLMRSELMAFVFSPWHIVKMSIYGHVIYQCWADTQSAFQFWLVRTRSEPWLNFETGINFFFFLWAGPGFRFPGLFQKFKQLFLFQSRNRRFLPAKDCPILEYITYIFYWTKCNHILEIRVSFYIEKTNKKNFPKINPYKEMIYYYYFMIYNSLLWDCHMIYSEIFSYL
jgi:hypothetical protein